MKSAREKIMTILDKIIARKKEEIAFSKSKISINELKNSEDEEVTNAQVRKIFDSSKTSDSKLANQLKDNIVIDVMDRGTLNLIYKAVKDNADENGWANLGMVGLYISAVKPDFDSRNYGRAKLSGLIKTLNLFETKVEMSQMYLRKMKKQSA